MKIGDFAGWNPLVEAFVFLVENKQKRKYDVYEG